MNFANFSTVLFHRGNLPSSCPNWIVPIDIDAGTVEQLRGISVSHVLYHDCQPSDLQEHVRLALQSAQQSWVSFMGKSQEAILPAGEIDWKDAVIQSWDVSTMSRAELAAMPVKARPAMLNYFDLGSPPNQVQRNICLLVDSALVHLRTTTAEDLGDKRLSISDVRDYASVVICTPQRTGRSSLIAAMHKAPGHYVGIPVDGEIDGEPDDIFFENFPPALRADTSDAEIIWVDLDSTASVDDCMAKAFEFLGNRYTAENCPLLVFLQSTWAFVRGNLDNAY